MKYHQNKKQLFGAIMIALAIVGSASLGVFADNEIITEPKTYKIDAFDAEYSNGYFPNFDNELTTKFAFGSGFTVSSTTNGTAHNHSKDENTYVDIYQGAHYNGRDLDMRIYTWASNGQYNITVTGGVIELGLSDTITMTSIEQEYHFYEAGTLSSGPAQETSFKGIFALSDVDTWRAERFSFPSGGAGIYLSSNTNIYFRDGAWGGRTESSPSNLESWIWVEANSLATNPLRVSYTADNGSHISQIREPNASTVTLNFPASDGKEAITYQVVQYGTFDISKLEVTPNDPNLSIEGWYTTDRYEIKYPEKFTVDGDISLYAKYVENDTTTGPESPTKGTDPTEILPDGPGSIDPATNNPTDSNSSSGDSNNNSNSSNNANADSNTSQNNNASTSANTSTGSNNNVNASANNSNRATSATNTQITYATDSDNIAVPSTSVYTPTRAVTTSSATQVSYPNTGFQTSQTNSVDGVTTVNVLRIVLAIIGVAGVVQIISARHHKLHF